MFGVFRRSVSIGFCALGLSLLACSAQAGPILVVQNPNFVDYSGTFPPKALFNLVKPDHWVAGGNANLTFIDAPGAPVSPTLGCFTCADGVNFLTTYGPFPNPPVPGNYLQADGNPPLGGSFGQSISGLTPGTTYTLTFYQAGTQQKGAADAPGAVTTNERWIVSLATDLLQIGGPGPVDPIYGPTATYFSSDPLASIVASPLMTTPLGTVTPWQQVSIDLTAHATTEFLSFLAWGDNGATANLPPVVFLSGINSPTTIITTADVPEPGTMTLFALGLAGLGVVARRRRTSTR